MNEQSINRNPTSADRHRTRILDIIEASPGVLVSTSTLAQALDLGIAQTGKLVRGLVRAGKLLRLQTMTGPGGGTAYEVVR